MTVRCPSCEGGMHQSCIQTPWDAPPRLRKLKASLLETVTKKAGKLTKKSALAGKKGLLMRTLTSFGSTICRKYSQP